MPALNVPGAKPLYLKRKPDAKIDITNPVTAQWYPVLAETPHVQLRYILVRQGYTEARVIETKITIDGVELEDTGGTDMTENLTYHVHTFRSYVGEILTAVNPGAIAVGTDFDMEGHSVKIEIRTTELIDGDKHLFGAVFYSARE